MPCYNCSETLREAVASCYAQGFTDDEFEIVMVNDCSTDDTGSVMKELSRAHSNIHIFDHEENRGGGAARNTAVHNARGEVIFCLDGDDILIPGTLKHMRDFLIEKNADGVAFNFSTKFEGKNTSAIVKRDNYHASGAPLLLDSLIERDGQPSPLLINFMYTKRAHGLAGGYPEHHGFDTQSYGWRFLAAGLSAYVCPNTDYLHRVNFHESYYLREYNAGRANLNIRSMLLEHRELFSSEALAVINSFDYKNFTRNLLEELRNCSPLFIPDVQKHLHPKQITIVPIPTDIVLTKRNSMRGIALRLSLRIRAFLRKLFTHTDLH